MNRKFVSIVAGGVLLAGAVAIAQEAGKKTEGGMPPMPKPAAELQKLTFLTGKWQGKDKFFPSEMMPEGGTGDSTLEASWDLDNFFLHVQLQSKSPAMKYAAHGFIAWNAEEKVYDEWWFDNFGMSTPYTGKFEGDSLVFTGDVQTMKGKAHQKVTFTKTSPTQVKLTVEYDAGQGFKKELETTYTKQSGM
jgi:hypothetical protein